MNEAESPPAPKYDFFSDQVFSSPFDMFAKMRSEDPVYRHPLMNMWIVTRYQEVREICRDREGAFSSERVEGFLAGADPSRAAEVETVRRFYSDWLVLIDPPRHTRIRSLLNKAFSPKSIEALRPNVEAVVDASLERLRPGETADLMADFATPIPLRVIADMLGVDAEDMYDFKRWADEAFQIVTLVGGLNEKLSAACEGIRSLEAYFRDRIAQRRTSPTQDILSGLVNASEGGDALSDQEIVSTCAMLLVAGHETTASLIGNGLLALLRNPGQLEKLRSRPELIKSAVEEILRYDGAAPGVLRVAKKDIDLGGQHISRGDLVLAITHAANRDPDAFEQPDTLDIERGGTIRHVAFAHGMHSCLGASLARLETQVAVSKLVDRFPDMKLAAEGELEWVKSLAVRGVASLPVTL